MCCFFYAEKATKIDEESRVIVSFFFYFSRALKNLNEN